MKKIVFLMAVATLAFSVNSCSSDSDGGSAGKITMRVNGVLKIFKTVTVVEQEIGGTDGFIRLNIEGTFGTAATEAVRFKVNQNETGPDQLYDFEYVAGGVGYYDDISVDSEIDDDVDSNTEHKLEGTFTGVLERNNSAAFVTITEGTFKIKH